MINMKNLGKYNIINLEKYYNNNGISYRENMSRANFTGRGSSFPAEELPKSNEIVKINEVPLLFPSKEENKMNNFDLFNQKIKVHSKQYRKIHILGASENGSFEEEINLLGGGYEEKVRFGLTDCASVEPIFGEILAIRCKGLHTQSSGYIESIHPTIWYKEIDVSHINFPLELLEFPDNASMHIFAITLEERG